jgi:hypothetical protein
MYRPVYYKSYNMPLNFRRITIRFNSIWKSVAAGRALPPACLLVFSLLIAPGQALCQDSILVVPDGTQGETFKINKADTIPRPLTFENWNQFDGSLTTLRIGGGFLCGFQLSISMAAHWQGASFGG